MSIEKSFALACRSGSKDAVYNIQVVKREGGYTVDYQNGRRGGTLTSGTKTKEPVSLEAATKIFDKVVKEKMTASPPYVLVAQSGTSHGESQNMQAPSTAMSQVITDMQARQTGITAQLLMSIYENGLANVIHDDNVVGQQKFDGERRFLISQGERVIAANRKGLEIPVDPNLVAAVQGVLCTLDGEHVGNHFYAFDLLEFDGRDYKNKPYRERKAKLDELSARFGPCITVAQDAFTAHEKRDLLNQTRDMKQEGVVFKKLDAVYGIEQLKFKYTQDASVIVSGCKDDRRSVTYHVRNEKGQIVDLGAVTIPPNFEIPEPGTLVDVRYVYANQGGSLFQPVYKGPRTDLDISAANVAQLKFKADHVEIDVAFEDFDRLAMRQRVG